MVISAHSIYRLRDKFEGLRFCNVITYSKISYLSRHWAAVRPTMGAMVLHWVGMSLAKWSSFSSSSRPHSVFLMLGSSHSNLRWTDSKTFKLCFCGHFHQKKDWELNITYSWEATSPGRSQSFLICVKKMCSFMSKAHSNKNKFFFNTLKIHLCFRIKLSQFHIQAQLLQFYF